MPGALEVLTKIKSEGLTPMVVTGSGQTSLLDRLNHNFPGIFQANLMVTAFDVKYGKPNPEPYLMALKKGGFKPNEALVIENAPLGVQAGVAAGIFTIAVNTGPLHDNVLLNEGANLLFHSMPDFNENWETLKLLKINRGLFKPLFIFNSPYLFKMNEGSEFIFHSMPDFNKNWETLQSALKQEPAPWVGPHRLNFGKNSSQSIKKRAPCFHLDENKEPILYKKSQPIKYLNLL